MFSNPNNPTGVVYGRDHLRDLCEIAKAYDAWVIVDQLYCRQIFDGRPYTHLRGLDSGFDNCITVLGPSKTESLSGYRLGAAVGPRALVDRMEALQGLLTLRAPGYSQAALMRWFAEPDGWLAERVAAHRAIRDDLMEVIAASKVGTARLTEGGSYLFLRLGTLDARLDEFVSRLHAQAGVVVTRGLEFGDYPSEVRLNFSQDHAAAVAAVRRLISFAETF